MTDKSNLPRYVFGGLALAAGLAIIVYSLAYLGFFMRVGVVSGSMRMLVYVLIGALALPPMIVGLHTIFWRHRNDPTLNDKAQRSGVLCRNCDPDLYGGHEWLITRPWTAYRDLWDWWSMPVHSKTRPRGSRLLRRCERLLGL